MVLVWGEVELAELVGVWLGNRENDLGADQLDEEQTVGHGELGVLGSALLLSDRRHGREEVWLLGGLLGVGRAVQRAAETLVPEEISGTGLEDAETLLEERAASEQVRDCERRLWVSLRDLLLLLLLGSGGSTSFLWGGHCMWRFGVLRIHVLYVL